jgi:predicted O-methyltransferase YrrM
MSMEPSRRHLIDELAARGREHDAALEDRLQRLRNVETETAELMSVLVRALCARRLLELGTSNGYSTLWLGDAAQSTGGALVSVDVDERRTAMAAGNVARAGLADVVELRSEDAAAVLRACGDGVCDFVFLDAERPAYVDYWADLVRVLARPGLLVVDNAVSHADELDEFAALVHADERVLSTVVPVGAGAMLVSRN